MMKRPLKLGWRPVVIFLKLVLMWSVATSAPAKTRAGHYGAPVGALGPQKVATFSWEKKMGLDLTAGLSVKSIEPFSFASVISPQCRGVQIGDQIRELNGLSVRSQSAFAKLSREFASAATQSWSLLVERKKKLILLEPAVGYLCDPVTLLRCGPSAHSTTRDPRPCLDIQGQRVR